MQPGIIPPIMDWAQLANLTPHFRQNALCARQLLSGLAGVVCRCREARGASRGNAVRFPVKRRVFPQLAVRASRQRRWVAASATAPLLWRREDWTRLHSMLAGPVTLEKWSITAAVLTAFREIGELRP
jgi:hypothetical protein